MEQVSPGVNPRPSLNAGRLASIAGRSHDGVAGGEPPALIERIQPLIGLPAVPYVSPGVNPRPSLNVAGVANPPSTPTSVSPGVNPRPSLNGHCRSASTPVFDGDPVSPGVNPRPSLNGSHPPTWHVNPLRQCRRG